MNTPAISLRVPVELADKLKALSVATGWSVSELIVACMKRAYPYVEDAARKSPKQ